MNEKKRELVLILISLVIGWGSVLLLWRPSQAEIKEQENLAEQILRFHVLANSDTKEDQEKKLEVRDAVLKVLAPVLKTARNKEEAKELIWSEKEEICKAARKAAYPDPVKMMVCRDEFPVKTYGKYTFPSGMYEALRLEVGKGEGHNWWCVLYPGFCFAKEEEDKMQLVLDEKAYEMIRYPVKTRIRFRTLEELLEFFQRTE